MWLSVARECLPKGVTSARIRLSVCTDGEHTGGWAGRRQRLLPQRPKVRWEKPATHSYRCGEMCRVTRLGVRRSGPVVHATEMGKGMRLFCCCCSSVRANMAADGGCDPPLTSHGEAPEAAGLRGDETLTWLCAVLQRAPRAWQGSSWLSRPLRLSSLIAWSFHQMRFVKSYCVLGAC